MIALQSPQLMMVRALNDLPELFLPEGISLRTYRDGDGKHWETITDDAFGRPPVPGWFETTMKSSISFRPERVLFLLWNLLPVATASAWVDEVYGPGAGMLHYVGVMRHAHGHGLGYSISLAALDVMQHEGSSRVLLRTDDDREPVIGVYLKLGFVPFIAHENQPQRWRDVFTRLGPILSWMAGDRIVSVSCRRSGHHHHDPRGRAYENEDTCVMLAKTAAKALVNIRVDMLSDRPGSRNIYQLHGTDGCYESARAPDQNDRVWLRDHCPGVDAWLELEELAESHLPEHWGQYATHAPHVGHGGSELYLLDAFINSVTGNGPVAIGIHEAMDLTLPGLISQESILQEGAWIQVPASRAW